MKYCLPCRYGNARAFALDVTVCLACGGCLRLIAALPTGMSYIARWEGLEALGAFVEMADYPLLRRGLLHTLNLD